MEGIFDIFLPYQKKFALSEKKRKIWIAGRQLGKSLCVGGLLVLRALENGPRGLSLCISTGARAASEIVKKSVQFAEAVKLLSHGSISYTSSYDKVVFSNGARVLSLPGSTDGSSLRGWSAQCVCCDEAAFIPHLDSILQAIAPTLTRDKDAELILTSTPAGRNGPFYDLFTRASSDDRWFVQQTTVHDAIKDGLDVDLEALHTLCPDPDVFAQEYECRFAASSSGLCDIEKLIFKQIDTSRCRKLIGIDVGVKSDRTAIAIVSDMVSTLHVDEVIVLSRASFEEQLEVIKLAQQKHQFRAGFIDSTGIGYGLSELVSKKVTPLIQPLHFTAQNKTSMHEQLRADLMQGKVTFDSKLKSLICDDFRMVERFVTDSGQVRFQSRHDSTGHADSASAVLLADAAWHKHPSRASQPDVHIPMSVFR